jgi:ABC-type sugar transport system ATPase subunit
VDIEHLTHDQQEALIIADLLAIMNAGRIEQVGTFEDIYDRPTNVFAGFLNLEVHTPPLNLLEGRYVAEGLGDVLIGARPEDTHASREQKENWIRATVKDRFHLPVKDVTVLTLRVGENEVVARAPIKEHFALNDEVWLNLTRYHVFEKKSGRRVRTHPA